RRRRRAARRPRAAPSTHRRERPRGRTRPTRAARRPRPSGSHASRRFDARAHARLCSSRANLRLDAHREPTFGWTLIASQPSVGHSPQLLLRLVEIAVLLLEAQFDEHLALERRTLLRALDALAEAQGRGAKRELWIDVQPARHVDR